MTIRLQTSTGWRSRSALHVDCNNDCQEGTEMGTVENPESCLRVLGVDWAERWRAGAADLKGRWAAAGQSERGGGAES